MESAPFLCFVAADENRRVSVPQAPFLKKTLNTIGMKKSNRIYEAPELYAAAALTERGFAESGDDGYNSYGLQDLCGTHVSDQSDEWNL